MEPGRARWICARHGRMSPELLLGWLGITDPPVDPLALAEALDVVVAEDDLGRYVGVLAMSERHAGILLNTCSAALDQRLAAARAIGHLVLHEGGEFRDTGSGSAEPVELEADLYAARLLMPASWLARRLACGDTVEVLALAFGVSEAAMRARLRFVRRSMEGAEQAES